jgi:hypothetical protein
MTKFHGFARLALIATCVAGVGMTAAFAGDDVTPEQIKAARAALNAAHVTQQFDPILPTIADQLKSSLIQASPNYTDVINDTVDGEALALAPRRADLEKEAAKVYAKTFTVEELKAIADFYNSPTGQKFLKVAPIAQRELMKAGDIWANGISRDMSKTASDLINKKIAAQKKQ